MSKKSKTATFKHPSKAVVERKLKALTAHAEEHPKCTVTQRHLQKLQKKLQDNKHWQEDFA